MRYVHLFWKLFGLPITAWDDLPFGDFLWMKATADRYEAALKQQEREAARG